MEEQEEFRYEGLGCSIQEEQASAVAMAVVKATISRNLMRHNEKVMALPEKLMAGEKMLKRT